MDAERLLNALKIPALAVDASGRISFANPPALRLLDWDPSLIGQPLTTLVPPHLHVVADQPFAAWLVARVREKGERPLRIPALRKDGVCIEVECIQSTVVGDEGFMLLTLLKRPDSIEFATDRLGLPDREPPDEREQRYRQVFEYAPIGIFHFDARGIITACNEVFVGVIGSSYRLLVGLDMSTLHDERIKACLRGALAGARTHYEGDYRSATGGKTTPVRVDFAPIFGAGGAVIGGVGIVEDITERKRAEEERARLLADEQAARSQAEDAVRARDEFLAVASHELRTPLTSVRLTVEYLRELFVDGQLSDVPEEVLRKSVERADRQSRHLARLVEVLLDVSRIQAGRLSLNLEEQDLADVVRSGLSRVEPQLTAARCTAQLESVPARGCFDRTRIEQVVTNLVSNAAKFAAGTTIDIRVRREGRTLILEVQDHGIGIAREEQERIFQRFERGVSARRYGGLGLGLFITRHLVEAHGGAIAIASEPGVGTTFTVRLPARPDDA